MRISDWSSDVCSSDLHDPPVLILDEPTDGLDPNQKHEVRDLIREMSPGRTILISTHILEEVPSVCTRAIIIADGRILADATPAELLAQSRYAGALSVRAADTVAVRSALEGLAGEIGRASCRERVCQDV